MIGRATLLACVLSACGSKTPAPAGPAAKPVAAARLPEGPPLLTPHEVMSYRIEIGGMDLATYDIGVGEVAAIGDKKAIAVQCHAKSRGLAAMLKNVDDTFTSWIDIQTGRPIRWSVEESAPDEGGVRERTEAHLDERDGDLVPVDVAIDGKPAAEKPQKVSLPDVWDYNAFVVALRAWEAPPGSTAETEVFRSRYMWHVRVTVHGKEKVVTELGEFPTLRFDGHAYRLERDGSKATDDAERDFSIWISDDQGRVPVQTVGRTDYGDIKMTIVDYQPGNGERLRP